MFEKTIDAKIDKAVLCGLNSPALGGGRPVRTR